MQYTRYPVEAGGVTSLDGMTGAITLVAGPGITIVDGSQTITISSTSAGDVTIGAFGSTPNANGLSISGSQVLNMQPADATHPGGISVTDWNTFNNKQNALTLTNLTDAGTDGIVITNGTGAVVGASPVTLAQHVADSTHNGYLSSTDWSTFNGKQASGNYITALTGDVTASGPGSAAATLATVNSNVGSFTNANITVNAKGLITAAANGSGGSGANTALSNLAAVAINTSLLPGAGGTISLGASSKDFASLFMSGQIKDSSGNNLIDPTNFRAMNAGTNVTLNWGTGFLANNSGVSVLTWNAGGSGTSITVPATSSQLVLGVTNTTTISATAPASSAVYTIPDVGTSANFVMSAGNQTVAGNKTFSGTTNLSALTASTALVLDSSKNIASLAYTDAATASTLMSRDANANVRADNFIEGYTTTATAAGTTTLTVDSTYQQFFTGVTTQTVVLPVASTLVLGQSFFFTNASTGVVTVNSSGANLVQSLAAGASCIVTCILTSGTTAASWSVTSLGTTGGAVSPTVQKFTSGSGTYTTPANVTFIRVRMIGGGGGGASGGTASGTAATGGGNSTFGTTLLVANGGALGPFNGGQAAGGTASLGTGPIGTAITGGGGEGGATNSAAGATALAGGNGGNGVFGGAGGGGGAGAGTGSAAAANSGAGGGGGGTNTTASALSGGGGGAGGFVDAIITSPLSSYAYAVGSAGSGATAGTSGFAGGAGGAGYIEVTEYYANGAIGTATTITGTVSSANVTTATFTAPTVQKFLSGSGTYTLPTSPRAPLYIRIKMVGGGGGGSGSQGTTGSGGNGGDGGTTTFGSSLLTATGGVGGKANTALSSGGTPTINSPAVTVVSLFGVSGQAGGVTIAGSTQQGGAGGNSFFGNAGVGTGTGAGTAGSTNSGSGGGGGLSQFATSGQCGTGGASGAYIEAIISAPSATYAYGVGAAGTAGTAGTGTSSFAGGAGGSGVVIVEEYYQ